MSGEKQGNAQLATAAVDEVDSAEDDEGGRVRVRTPHGFSE